MIRQHDDKTIRNAREHTACSCNHCMIAAAARHGWRFPIDHWKFNELLLELGALSNSADQPTITIPTAETTAVSELDTARTTYELAEAAWLAAAQTERKIEANTQGDLNIDGTWRPGDRSQLMQAREQTRAAFDAREDAGRLLRIANVHYNQLVARREANARRA